MKSVSFGWELNSVKNDGADLYCKIEKDITICGIEMDVAFMVTASPGWSGSTFAEVLCTASVTPSLPTFTPGPAAYNGGASATPEFGPSKFYVPVTAEGAHGAIGGGGGLASVILKTWVASPPVANASQRNVVITGLSIPVLAGSYLVFHMDHAGYPGDVEMQGNLFYQ